MGHINLTINGRNFGMECDDGQEQRVLELGHYVEQKIKSIASAGAAHGESHLLLLTALMLTDEVFELRENLSALAEHIEGKEAADHEEEIVVQMIDTISERIESLADRVQKAA